MHVSVCRCAGSGMGSPLTETKSADGEIKLSELGDRINLLVPFIRGVICEDPDCQDMVGIAWVEWTCMV